MGVDVAGQRLWGPGVHGAVDPVHGQLVGTARGSGQIKAVAGTDRVQAQVELRRSREQLKGNLHPGHIAVGRPVDRGVRVARKDGQVVHPAAARTNGLVNDAVGVEARGSAVDVLVHRAGSAKISGIRRLAAPVQGQEVKVLAVGRGLQRVGRGEEVGHQPAVEQAEPAREVGRTAVVHLQCRGRNPPIELAVADVVRAVDAVAGRRNPHQDLGGIGVLKDAGGRGERPRIGTGTRAGGAEPQREQDGSRVAHRGIGARRVLCGQKAVRGAVLGFEVGFGLALAGQRIKKTVVRLGLAVGDGRDAVAGQGAHALGPAHHGQALAVRGGRRNQRSQSVERRPAHVGRPTQAVKVGTEVR